MRLTDEELDELDEFLRPFETGDSGADLTRRALAELRERRAQDLTAEDVEALEFARERVSFNLNCSVASEYFSDEYADRHRHAIDVIFKLLTRGNR